MFTDYIFFPTHTFRYYYLCVCVCFTLYYFCCAIQGPWWSTTPLMMPKMGIVTTASRLMTRSFSRSLEPTHR